MLKTSEPTKLPQKETQQKPNTKPKPNLDAHVIKTDQVETTNTTTTTNNGGKNDAVMRDVLDSWGAEEGIFILISFMLIYFISNSFHYHAFFFYFNVLFYLFFINIFM